MNYRPIASVPMGAIGRCRLGRFGPARGSVRYRWGDRDRGGRDPSDRGLDRFGVKEFVGNAS